MIKGICLLCEKAFSMQPATECVTLQFQLSSEKIDITDHISSLFYVEVDRVFTPWTILAHLLNKTSIPSYFFKADLAVLPEKKEGIIIEQKYATFLKMRSYKKGNQQLC